MKKLLLVLSLLLVTPLVAVAEYFNVNGICYSITGEGEITVYRDNYSGNVVIPETVTYNGKTFNVVGISEQAFMNCHSLTSVSIPNTIKHIGNSAFYYCNSLTSVTIPNSVETLGSYAFFLCENLATVKIGNGLSDIREYTFFKCYALSNLTIGNSVKTIGSLAFYSCRSLDHVNIPNSVESIASEAFESCTGLNKLTLGNSLKSIGTGAFQNCTSLTNINFPHSLIVIGSNAFSETSITSVVLPNSLKEIWDNAFSECTSLTTLSIPANIREVRCYSFLDCVNLETIRSYVVDPDDAYFETYCFMGVPKSTCVVYVPKGSLAAYQNHHIWREFTHIVEMPDGLKGDVNGDGEVTVADVNAVINIILGGNGNTVAADVNGDHEISIADVNIIINIILGGSAPSQNHEYVDLGLPSGTLWATCNIGANKPEEYGDYFAWGETAPKQSYTWDTYKWCNGRDDWLTKYCTITGYGYNAFTDGKTELDPEDDAAYVNWGTSWRMPSREQMQELKTKCSWIWTMKNGVYGQLFTGSNGNTLFLPSAGFLGEYTLFEASNGYSWSRTLGVSRSSTAFSQGFDLEDVFWGENLRYYGFSVRAVRVSQ